jgi:Electron transfer DM13
MAKRKSIFISTGVVAFGLLWYLFRPDALVISKTVNEPFPAVAETGSMNHDPTSFPPTSRTSASSMRDSQMNHSKSSMMNDAHMGDSKMQESENHGPTTVQTSEMAHSSMGGAPASAAEPVEIAAGSFHSNAHPTKGRATIYRLDDGRRVLRLTEFKTSNGPDVRVYLVAAADVQKEDAAKKAGIVDLGALKGNVGDQNYDVPAGLDLSKYRAVSIWCRRFSVNFGAAPLADAGM